MAEGILSLMPLASPCVRASSAGTHALDGNPASEFSVVACGEQGVDISGHRARRLDDRIARKSDLIVCMEPAHIEIVFSLNPSAVGKTHNLADFSGGKLKKIADPYGCSLREYRQCFQDVLACLGNFLGEMGLLGCTRTPKGGRFSRSEKDAIM